MQVLQDDTTTLILLETLIFTAPRIELKELRKRMELN